MTTFGIVIAIALLLWVSLLYVPFRSAYTHDDPTLTPPDLRGTGLRVCAVASLYGQVSLAAMYEHASQNKVCHPEDPQPDWTAPPSPGLTRLFGANAARLRLAFMTYAGRCDWLLGGTPAEVPERYRRVSMLHHIRRDAPPTLLMQGTHDEMAPVSAVRQLADRLQQAGAPVTAIYLPHTDHMFELAGAMWSPAARVAFHTVERFLAVITGPDPTGHSEASHATPASASTTGLWKGPA
jgi:acetyl esterase/lipase